MYWCSFLHFGHLGWGKTAYHFYMALCTHTVVNIHHSLVIFIYLTLGHTGVRIFLQVGADPGAGMALFHLPWSSTKNTSNKTSVEEQFALNKLMQANTLRHWTMFLMDPNKHSFRTLSLFGKKLIDGGFMKFQYIKLQCSGQLWGITGQALTFSLVPTWRVLKDWCWPLWAAVGTAITSPHRSVH